MCRCYGSFSRHLCVFPLWFLAVCAGPFLFSVPTDAIKVLKLTPCFAYRLNRTLNGFPIHISKESYLSFFFFPFFYFLRRFVSSLLYVHVSPLSDVFGPGKIPAMLRTTAVKAASGSLSRGPACSACRRSYSALSSTTARSNNGSKFNVATRRPLALVSNYGSSNSTSGRRGYATAEDQEKGVVSSYQSELFCCVCEDCYTKSLLHVRCLWEDERLTRPWHLHAGPQRFLPPGQHGQLH